MTPEQDPKNLATQSALGPPEGPPTARKAIFWNENEFRAGWRLLIFLLLLVVFMLSGTFLISVLHLPELSKSGLTAVSMMIQEITGIVAAFLAAGIMSMLEDRRFGTYGLPRAVAFGAKFWQGAAWGIAMISAIVFLIRAFGGFSFGDLALHGAKLPGYAVLWGFVFILVGIFEEFLFRGYAQFTLATGIGFWPAATLLSAGFGAVHLHNVGEDKVGALSVFVIGMFFCLTLWRTGNLWFAVGLHAAFDWGETFLYSVPDSGLVAPGHLLNSSLHGLAWLTGGMVGPEGSVMSFVVVGISAVIFVFVYPKSHSTTASQPDEIQSV
jgi:membrane protease YdiL (CAAX protease family)